jgi:hypothetical protein
MFPDAGIGGAHISRKLQNETIAQTGSTSVLDLAGGKVRAD